MWDEKQLFLRYIGDSVNMDEEVVPFERLRFLQNRRRRNSGPKGV